MLRRLLLAGLAGAGLALAAPLAAPAAQAQPSVVRYSASAEPRVLDPGSTVDLVPRSVVLLRVIDERDPED